MLDVKTLTRCWTGTYQERFDRCERDHSDIEWTAGDGYVAGHMVLGVQNEQAFEEGCCYDPRGEDVR